MDQALLAGTCNTSADTEPISIKYHDIELYTAVANDLLCMNMGTFCQQIPERYACPVSKLKSLEA